MLFSSYFSVFHQLIWRVWDIIKKTMLWRKKWIMTKGKSVFIYIVSINLLEKKPKSISKILNWTQNSVTQSWTWSYGSWIYNYICNQFLSPLNLWVRIPLRRGVLDTTLCDEICQWLAAGRLFSLGTRVSSTN